MDQDKHLQLCKKINHSLMNMNEEIRNICEPLSNDEIQELADYYHQQSLPNDYRNFSIPMYQEISDLLTEEIACRVIFEKAERHMAQTGADFYCVACDGDCHGHD